MKQFESICKRLVRSAAVYSFAVLMGISPIIAQSAAPARNSAMEAQKTNLEEKLAQFDGSRLDKRYNFSQKDFEFNLKLVKKTLDESRRDKSYAIIIDKASYTFYLIKDGEFYSSYWVELGYNPFDDKTQEGDGCTPEGFYQVIHKRPLGVARFYKALDINYPNKWDWQDFKERKHNGELPRDARIGFAIQIHGPCDSGSSSRRFNWTDGCVSLSSDDMDEVYSLVRSSTKNSMGTSVTIVKYGANVFF